MLTAITREVSDSLGRCELTHLPRVPVDVGGPAHNMRNTRRRCGSWGCRLSGAPAAPELPDAVFVEDMAVVLDGGAVITHPGAISRRREATGIAEVLSGFGWIQFIEDGTVDGGDVLRIGRTFYVGRTGRTNEAGIRELERIVGPWGYQVRAVDVRGCLHLKSAVTQVADHTLLLNPAWLPVGAFGGF